GHAASAPARRGPGGRVARRCNDLGGRLILGVRRDGDPVGTMWVVIGVAMGTEHNLVLTAGVARDAIGLPCRRLSALFVEAFGARVAAVGAAVPANRHLGTSRQPRLRPCAECTPVSRLLYRSFG